MSLRRRLLSLPLALATGAAALPANAAVINGTSGTNTDATAYSTNGNLDLSLGFYAEYLIVGGGGGGGAAMGGGGGGGQVVESAQAIQVTSSGNAVVVGAGGAGATSRNTSGANGGASSVFGISATGGGGGGGWQLNGVAGASGGGGGAGDTSGSSPYLGGSASSGSVGGSGGNDGHAAVGGGGGGAGGQGGDANTSTQTGGAGGSGATSTMTGTSVAYAGGGGGGSNDGTDADPTIYSAGGGGSGSAGGGDGAYYNNGSSTRVAATDATANSGSGGGGGGNTNFEGGDGGSGIVVVRYKSDIATASGGTASSFAGSNIGQTGTYQVNTFTADGTFTVSENLLGATLTTSITGSGSLTFSGPGTLTLNAVNGYTGATSIAAGTLAIGASGSIETTTGVAIASGATFDVSGKSGFAIGSGQTLSGVGTVAGAISIAGTHSPGSSPGIQTFSSDLTYTNGANVDWELIANTAAIGSAGTSYDQIGVGGNLDFTGPTTLDLIFNASGSAVDWNATFWDADQTWVMWDDLSSGTVSNLGNLSINTSSWLDSNSVLFATARPDASFTVSQLGQDVLLVYTAVPEPSTLVTLPAAGLALLGFRRLRRRQTARGTGRVTA